jgi:hypothetical protein
MLAAMRSSRLAVVFALTFAGCGDGSSSGLAPDATLAIDASPADGAPADGAATDASVDASTPDAEPPPDAAPDAVPTHRVRLVVAGEGRGQLAADGDAVCPGACEIVVPAGTRISLTAAPEDGWMFAGWDGPCHGVEGCDLRVDADLDVTATFSARTAAWARRWGGTSYDVATRLQASADDEITVAGRCSGQAGFGGRTFDCTAFGNPFFVARYGGRDGGHRWSTHGLGGIRDLAILPGGDVVVLVAIGYTASIEDQRWYGTVRSLLVVRLDGATGAVRWGTSLTGEVRGNDVIVDHGKLAVKADGSVVVVATALGTFEVAGHRVSSTDGDVLIAELAGDDGVVRWATSVGGTGDQRASAIAVDDDGDVVVAGWFSDALTLGDTTYEAPGRSDSFLLELHGPEHRLGWRRVLGGGAFDQLAIDRGRLVAVGRLRGPVDLGGGPLVVIPTEAPADESPPVDTFVASLDVDDGSHRWSRVIDAGYWPRGFGATQNLGFEDLVIAPSGDVYLGGYLDEAIDVAATGIVYPTRTDGIVVRLAADTGVADGVTLVGGAGRSSVNALAVSPAGALFAAGGVVAADVIGGFALPSIGDVDTFVTRLAAPTAARR